MTVLLVTGSRALCVGRGGTVESERWARERIAEALRGVTRLVTGDASGPDCWALEESMNVDIPAELWQLNGQVIFAPTTSPARVLRLWTEERRPRFGDRAAWRERCLARDRAMVRALPDGARVVALVAPWSKTGGAAYTARHAERRGLMVEVCECPAEYGAEGAER